MPSHPRPVVPQAHRLRHHPRALGRFVEASGTLPFVKATQPFEAAPRRCTSCASVA